MITGERAQGIPGHLRIVVAMVIDKPRRDHQAVGIDGACRGAAQFAYLDNLAVGTATSPRKAGVPEPSTTRPFLINRSYAMVSPPCRCLSLRRCGGTAPRRRSACQRMPKRAAVPGVQRTVGVSASGSLPHVVRDSQLDDPLRRIPRLSTGVFTPSDRYYAARSCSQP